LSEKSSEVKFAVTETSAFMVTMHVPVPEQAPPQPVKFEVDIGATISVTEVPGAKLAEQEPPHSIPGGLLVTVPLPLPARFTESVKFEVPAEPLITVTLPLTVFAV
jgi:hypothetical protein